MSAKAASGFGIVQRVMPEVKPVGATRSNAGEAAREADGCCLHPLLSIVLPPFGRRCRRPERHRGLRSVLLGPFFMPEDGRRDEQRREESGW
jgi:hypothetical protein